MTRRCREVAELGSAYLDDALLDVERDRLLRHLAGCPPCRTELQELRTVRGLLGRLAAGSAAAPKDLSQQLVLIAGPEARVPIWCRPFRRTRAGRLPRVRRPARIRFAVAAVSVGGLATASGVLGYLAAPPQPAVVADPGRTAPAEFAAMLSELPLSSRPADALMVTAQVNPLHDPGNVAAGPAGKARPVARPEALAVLRRAADAAGRVRFTGVQRVTVRRAGGRVTAAVRAEFEPGQGSALTVLGGHGQVVLSRFVPPATSAQVKDQMLALLSKHYAVAGWRGERLLGRSVTLVEAADPAAESGRAAARWWVDDATGLLLRQETYDASGSLTLGAGFTQVSISAKPVFLEHLAPRLAISTTTMSVGSPDATGLASHGWYCPDTVAGLSLVQLRSDRQGRPDRIHLLYSDGVHSLSVLEQRGTLAEPPAGSSWDGALHAYVGPGVPATASWRSGDTVLTVVSDAPGSLLARAVADLPHEKAVPATTMGRVRAGWSRLSSRVSG